MNNTSHKYKRAYIFALTLLALLTISTQIFIQFLLYNQKKDAHVINISGRQRMLSQKITKQALLILHSEDSISFQSSQKSLNESLNLWNQSHQALQSGDEEIDIVDVQLNEKTQNLFTQINPYQEVILKSGNSLLDISFTSSKSLKESIVNDIVMNEGIFLELMDKITFQFEYDSNQKSKNLAFIEQFLMIVTLIILLLEAWLIFRPITKKIQTSLEELELANKVIEDDRNRLKKSLEEVKSKGLELKRNASNLEITKKALLKQKNSIQNQKLLLEVAESVSKTASFDFRFSNNHITVSENAQKLLRLSPKQKITLDLILGFLKPSDIADFKKSLENTVKNKGKILEGVYQVKFHQQDQCFDYQFFGKIFYNSDQKPIRILGSVRDITEQITRQRELENTYEKLEKKQYELQNAYSLLEKSSEAARIGSWEIDLRANKVNWSKVAQEIHEIGNGFISAKDVVSGTEKWLTFYHLTEYQEKIEKALHNCLTSGTQFDIETQITTPKGQEKWIRVIGIPSYSGDRIIRLYGLFQDIDERKKVEDDLKKLAVIAQQTNDLIVVTDKQGCVEWVNNSFTRVTEYTFDEVKGKKPGKLLQGVDTQPEHIKKISDGIAKKEAFSQEILNYTKSGKPYWNYINITPILDEEQNVTKFIGIQYDITKLKEAEHQIRIKNKQLQIMLSTVEDQKNNILSSIEYAKRIQKAIFSKKEEIEVQLSEILLLYKPKDIVSGDFYWFTQIGDISYLAIADCTGHGVPGAFMTIIGMSLLEQIINKEQIFSPSRILHELDERMSNTLQQQGIMNQDIIDGMEVSFFKFNWKNSELIWASAKRPLWIFRNQVLLNYKGNPYSISGSKLYTDKKFEEQSILLEKNDKIYTFTDGYADQLGEQKNRKFMLHNFRNLIDQNHNKPFSEQKEILKKHLQDWQGNKEQTDDILIFGMQI